MQKGVEEIRQNFELDLEKAKTSSDLEILKVDYLGRKGPVQKLVDSLKFLEKEKRPQFGKEINDLKNYLSDEIEKKALFFLQKEEDTKFKEESLDVTLPGRRRFSGREHVITRTLDRIIDLLIELGFSVQYGPDIDTDYYNFEALNFPPDHPARDMQDTFYIAPSVILRTHTSNIQARVMEAFRPPIRIIAPGKAFRNEAVSARSHVFFHQVEALYIDKGVTFGDLLATLDLFLKRFFGKEIEIRYRPSYFPFVEPGMEVDISCISCGGSGCPLCKQTGWLEVAGAGMVHPEVLKNGGIDPEVFTGYAWGLGVERLVMLKHGVKDIRYFTINDLRFLRQFYVV